MWTELLRDVGRLLTFRRMGPGVRTHADAYLGFGLAMTWLAGIGRYWDNPRAELWQIAGLGSLAYVFSLALVLWLLILPLRARRWSYRNVLLFVCLTSPPALLYAIPVERFMSGEVALAANAWFLGIVASWRVALLLVFLKRDAGLRAWEAIVACLLPLALIVVSLALLNLEHVVFNLMSGIRAEDRSVNDAAYLVVLTLSYFSFLASPLLAIAYLWLVFRRRQGLARPQ
ncbi:MAG: hypothetical protein H4O13_07925 [Xanthomonadales bacterium]|nr:hypothetical protein [Xanthomonadales bacterium]